MVGTAVTRIRLEDFLADPEIDERRLELIDGEVYEKPMPTWGHGTIAGEIYFYLRPFGYCAVEPRAIIPRTPSFDASSPLPDVSFYREEPPAGEDWMRTPPHVAVEILSPGQSRREMRAKIDLYLLFGVESVWLVDPAERTVEVHEGGARRILTEDDTLVTPSVPGLELPVRMVFERAAAGG